MPVPDLLVNYYTSSYIWFWVLRRHKHHQVDVIRLHIHLHHLATILTEEDLNAVVNLLTDRPFQDSIPVFWGPNYVVQAMPDGMC